MSWSPLVQLKLGSGLTAWRSVRFKGKPVQTSIKSRHFPKQLVVVRMKNDGKPPFCSLTPGNNTALIPVLQQADSCAFVLRLVSVSDLPPLVVQLSNGCSRALSSSKTLLVSAVLPVFPTASWIPPRWFQLQRHPSPHFSHKRKNVKSPTQQTYLWK